MIYNSKEWHEKMNKAREFAGRRNTRMALIGHQVTYRDRRNWHYVIMTATMARSTGHLRRAGL